MLGDSFRRLQADELDADWDRLVAGAHYDNGTLASIAGALSEGIAPERPGARSRVRRRLFAPAQANAGQRATAPASSPIAPATYAPQPQQSPAKRWWSSPMVAFEVLAACLVIAALALGVSAYQAGNNSSAPHSLRTAAESTPSVMPAADWYQLHWDELNQMRAAVQPTLTSWDGALDAGKIRMTLVEAYFPIGSNASGGGYTGVALMSIVNGSVTVKIDSEEAVTLSAGETLSTFVNEGFDIRNEGPEIAYVVLGYIQYAVIPVPASTPSSDAPAADYYGGLLGNVVFDLPTEGARVTLAILDETATNREVQSTATELLVNQLGQISLTLNDGAAGVRGTGLEVTSDDYRNGTGYSPMTLGSTTVFGVSGTNILVQPGASYTLSTPPDTQVMAISLSIEQENP